MRKIIKNAIQCKLCGEIIESTYRHNLVACKCGACYVDGGYDYLRRGFNKEGCFIELSEYEELSKETIAGKDVERSREVVSQPHHLGDDYLLKI